MSIRQATKSLSSRHSPLSDTGYQLKVLNQKEIHNSDLPSFTTNLIRNGVHPLLPSELEIFQINVGKKCNQACGHCHVDAGPDRIEQMSREQMEICLDIIRHYDIKKVDITGGAPELNPNFRWFVEECRSMGRHIMNRCNLTIIVSNPKFNDLPQFFADNNVQLICSLPHFSKIRTDHQRGDGVFEDSIKALRMLNEVGYGMQGTSLILDLVHNPSGAFLPGDQKSLESEFKSQLNRKYGIHFNSLYSITNLPISRFLEYLIESGNAEQYMQTLIEAFNPATISNLMCRNTISVSWDGYLYDCDFNQMLDLKVASGHNHISTFNLASLSKREIVVNQHCYGCTAGAGSSCGGELISNT